MNRAQIKLVSNKMRFVTCDIVATYHDKDTCKDFVIYTDKKKLYSSLYEMTDNKKIKLKSIVDLRDKLIAKELVKQFANEI